MVLHVVAIPDILLAESVEVAWVAQLALGGERTFCRKTNLL